MCRLRKEIDLLSTYLQWSHDIFILFDIEYALGLCTIWMWAVSLIFQRCVLLPSSGSYIYIGFGVKRAI
jgi:hypothetical protein